MSRLLVGAGILLVLITNLSVITVPTSARIYLLHSTSTLAIAPEKSDLGILAPGESTTVTLNINYQYTKFAKPKGFLLSGTPTRINVTVENVPSWCTVELDKKVLYASIPVSSFFKGGNVTLSVKATITVLENAPGYEKANIKFSAMAEDNGNIKGSTAEPCIVTLKSDFVSGIDVEMDRYWLYLKPGESGDVSINITNRGNMPIVAKLTINTTDLDKISIIMPSDQVEIPVNETRCIKIGINAEDSNEYVNNQTILPMLLTYHAKGYSDLTGTPEDLSLTVLVKSAKKPIPIDPFIIVAIVAIVIVAIVAMAVYIKRRR